jgi:type VI secretion system protein ImpC
MSTPTPQTELQSKLQILHETLETKLVRDPSQARQAIDAVSELIESVEAGEIALSEDSDLIGAINQRIAALDQEVDQGLNEVMHHDAFCKLEASWRGLHYLVSRAETGTMLKLRLLNATKDEIQRDLERAVEFEKIYEEEYGTFGGSPYSVLIGDYEFGRSPQDIKWLEKMSNVAAAAHAPFIAAASPQMFDMDSFDELGNPRDLAKIFESTELVPWRSFRDSEDSRYVALCLPHFLLRSPYGRDTRPNDKGEDEKQRITGRIPSDDVDFQEEVDGNPKDYCWGNAAYALAERITNAFALYRWTAAIRGVEGGGLVEGLPAINFRTDEGDVVLKCPTEVAITDRREKDLNDLGFITLVHRKNTDHAAFFGGQTTQKPKLYQDPQASANARLSSQLPYVMAASRFAHYIKAMMRDKVGSFMTKENVSDYLNKWIADYVLLDDRASQASKASFPLREARVDVEDVVGKPGVYKAVVYLRPHFQLDELTASIRLVAELPPPAAA